MGVLDRLADRHEQPQALARRQAVVVAVLGDRHTVDQLHDEIRPAGFRGPGIEDAGDVDMVHHGQGLPLGLEAGDDLAAVHARLDDLEGDLALDGMRLLGHEDGAHAALADLLQQLVRADDRARRFLGRLSRGGRAARSRFEERPQPLLMPQEVLDFAAQCVVAAAGRCQVGLAFVPCGDFRRSQENGFRFAVVVVHSSTSGRLGLPALQCDDRGQTPPASAWFFSGVVVVRVGGVVPRELRGGVRIALLDGGQNARGLAHRLHLLGLAFAFVAW